MAKITEKSKGCQLIVKAKLSIGEKLDETELEKFSQKNVRGLLKVNRINKKKIEYTGPIGVRLYDRLKKSISKYDFFFIMEQFVDLYRKMAQAQLNVNNIIFDIEHIFINEHTKELQFIYLPMLQAQKAEPFDTMYHMIYTAKPMPEQENDYISRFVYFLRELPSFDPEKIEAYIAKEDRSVVNIIKRHPTGSFMTDKQADYYAHYDRESGEEATALLNEEEATALLSEEEATGLLNDGEATGLLIGEEYEAHATLYRVLTNESIPIHKQVYRLGKEKSYADYFISDNYAVSRSHADIIRREQRYFIMDLNSKNKTFVNGVAITPRKEVEIHEGDNVRLGNEEFIFHSQA